MAERERSIQLAWMAQFVKNSLGLFKLKHTTAEYKNINFKNLFKILKNDSDFYDCYTIVLVVLRWISSGFPADGGN